MELGVKPFYRQQYLRNDEGLRGLVKARVQCNMEKTFVGKAFMISSFFHYAEYLESFPGKQGIS